MVCDLLDGYLNALADGEDLGVVLIAEDARANRYQACFTEDGPEACLEGAQHFVEFERGGHPVRSRWPARSLRHRLRRRCGARLRVPRCHRRELLPARYVPGLFGICSLRGCRNW